MNQHYHYESRILPEKIFPECVHNDECINTITIECMQISKIICYLFYL